MNRLMSVMVAAIVIAGCSSNSTDPEKDASPQTALAVPTLSTFAGAWRATPPHPDFFRLTLDPKSSDQGGLAARLTFSGVYWEGSGRIEGDAFVANMVTPGVSGSNRVLTARATNPQTLAVTMRANDGSSMEFTFVREN